mgnify:CR=1 FL=1
MEKSSFTIRSYSKSELAMLYSPYITPKAAVRKLNRWIPSNPDFKNNSGPAACFPTPNATRRFKYTQSWKRWENPDVYKANAGRAAATPGIHA